MKKILFVTLSLGIGGIESSLVNCIDQLSSSCEITVFVFDKSGASLDRLPNNVRVIEASWRLNALASSVSAAKKKGLRCFLFKLFAAIWARLFSNVLPLFLAVSHERFLGEYDLGCAFSHESDKHKTWSGYIRLMQRKSRCKLSTAWIHCDYNGASDFKFNSKYYNLVDRVVGVSQSVINAFQKNMPLVQSKMDYCYNMLDYDKLYLLAAETIGNPLPNFPIVCFSACRLDGVKAIPRAIRCFADAMKKNNVIWLIAGDGKEKKNIENEIQRFGLADRVILLGLQANPYKYMRRCDLYLSTSYEEAAPMVYLEAKALHVPVFSTKTLSAEELLDREVDYICENSEESIKTTFDLATSNLEELQRRKKMLEHYQGNNDFSMGKFKEWLGNEN